jgi:YfiH family protein
MIAGGFPLSTFLDLPSLAIHDSAGVRYWSDDTLSANHGVVVAFTARLGGVSAPPFDSLNLAAHVGDDPSAVDENRSRLLDALGLGALRDRLTTSEQVHGTEVAHVTDSNVGAGAFASGGPRPIAGTDALMSKVQRAPILMLYADCVPIVLVAPGPTVCVVHAGWRGALARLPGRAVDALASFAGCAYSEVTAYLGPHVGGCCYQTGDDIMSHFVNVFGTFARAESGALDLCAVVQNDLTDAGVSRCRITCLGSCTAEETDQFFSYRTEGGLTGRHGAIACILPSSS